MLMPVAHRAMMTSEYMRRDGGLSSHKAEGAVFSRIAAFQRSGC
jgi:hypothetical protein